MHWQPALGIGMCGMSFSPRYFQFRPCIAWTSLLVARFRPQACLSSCRMTRASCESSFPAVRANTVPHALKNVPATTSAWNCPDNAFAQSLQQSTNN